MKIFKWLSNLVVNKFEVGDHIEVYHSIKSKGIVTHVYEESCRVKIFYMNSVIHTTFPNYKLKHI